MRALIVFTYLAVAFGFGFGVKEHRPEATYLEVAAVALLWPALWGAAQVDASLGGAE